MPIYYDESGSYVNSFKDIAIYSYKNGDQTISGCGDKSVYEFVNNSTRAARFNIDIQSTLYRVHSLTGPAIIYVDGTFEWFIDGEHLTKIQWLDRKSL
jgi:hypothetical protein